MASDRDFLLHSSNLPSNSYIVFEDMRRKGLLCDTTVKVGERSFSAHRIVLAAGIPYFRETFYNGVATEVFEKEIGIRQTDYSAFEALIEYAYSCKITITFENVKHLLSAASAWHVEEVRKACCEYLRDRLDPDSVSDIRNYAQDLKCLDLVEITEHYIRKNFDKVSESESFLNLPFSFLEELIRKDDLRVSSEEKVFESVIRWVKNSPVERCTKLPELLKNVRLTLLDLRYLSSQVGSHEFIRTSIMCRDLVDEAKNYHLFPEKQQEVFSFPIEPRKSEDATQNNVTSPSDEAKNYHVCPVKRQEVFSFPIEPRKSDDTDQNNVTSPSDAAYCTASKESTYKTKKKKRNICKIKVKTICSLECFDSERNRWYTFENRTIHHDNGSAAKLDNKAYLFFKYFTLEYDPKNDDLQFYIGSGRHCTGAAVLNDWVYVCGGIDSTVTNCVQAFDAQKKEWLEVPNMISRRMSPGVVTLRGYIYVLGGTNVYTFRGVESYSIEDQIWSLEEPMLTRRYALGCAAVNDKIYVCGGIGVTREWLNTAEVFDLSIYQWKFISLMNKSRSKISLVPYRGKLYAFGSFKDEEIPLSTVEVYNPKTDEWLFSQSVDSSIICGAVVVLTM